MIIFKTPARSCCIGNDFVHSLEIQAKFFRHRKRLYCRGEVNSFQQLKYNSYPTIEVVGVNGCMSELANKGRRIWWEIYSDQACIVFSAKAI